MDLGVEECKAQVALVDTGYEHIVTTTIPIVYLFIKLGRKKNMSMWTEEKSYKEIP